MALGSKVRGSLLVMLLAGSLALAIQVVAKAEPLKATYYSNWYAGKPTASGELYDPQGFTAAHPYLPFDTKLLVTYNGRGVIVTVNDRIPREGNYDLDLSWAAAKALGLIDIGTAAVAVEVIEAQPAPPA
jgi:rare lipoprotein A